MYIYIYIYDIYIYIYIYIYTTHRSTSRRPIPFRRRWGSARHASVVYKWPQASARNGPGVYFEFFSSLRPAFVSFVRKK